MTTPPSTQMASEIAEQPAAARRTLDHLLPERDRLRSLGAGRRRVLLVARGSSDNAAIYGRYLLEVAAGVPAALAAPSVATHYGARLDLSDTLVVSVSQSGATAEIVETQDWARRCGAATVAVTNVADSPLAAEADVALVTQAGPELAVPATKTYLTQLVALAVVADALGAGVEESLARVPDAVAALLPTDVSAAAQALAAADEVVVSGRGLLLGTALETALKLEETCLRPVRGYSYADLRHGPISVVTDGVLAVLVAASDGPLAGPDRCASQRSANAGVPPMPRMRAPRARRSSASSTIGPASGPSEAATRTARTPSVTTEIGPWRRSAYE